MEAQKKAVENQWDYAKGKILSDIERDGYGLIYTHEEIEYMLGVEKPKGKTDLAAVQEYQFKLMGLTQGLMRDLLVNHNVYLSSVRGTGYMVMHPKDQVATGFERHLEEVRKDLRKAIRCVTNVHQPLLDDAAKKLRDSNLARAVFVKNSLRKR